MNGLTRDATHDAQDRLITHGANTYDYTPTGNLRTRTGPGGTTTLDYDSTGGLPGVTLPGGTRITYLLDPVGRRIGRLVNGTITERLIYSGDRPVAQLDSNGAIVSRFIYAGGLIPAYLTRGTDTFRIIEDHTGSVRLVVHAATGEIVQRLDYDSYGNVTLDTNPGFQPFGFAGGLYDPDTRLVRFGMRDYDPETGRWTAKDPIGLAGNDANLYRYCYNNPVNLTDPSGLDAWDFFAGVFDEVIVITSSHANPLVYELASTEFLFELAISSLGIEVPSLLDFFRPYKDTSDTDSASTDYAFGSGLGTGGWCNMHGCRGPDFGRTGDCCSRPRGEGVCFIDSSKRRRARRGGSTSNARFRYPASGRGRAERSLPPPKIGRSGSAQPGAGQVVQRLGWGLRPQPSSLLIIALRAFGFAI